MMGKMTDSRAAEAQAQGGGEACPHCKGNPGLDCNSFGRTAPPSAPVGVEDTRGAFERWVAKRHGCGTERWADSGKYRYDDTNAWWECWQTALAQQPAAVDGAMERYARYWRTLMAHSKRDHIWYHVLPPDLTEKHDSIESVLDALAAQPGGSDNDR